MSRMTNVTNITTVGSAQDVATEVKLIGMIFRPGSAASTCEVLDGATTLFTLSAAADASSIPVMGINTAVADLDVDLTGTGAEAVFFTAPIRGG